MGYTEVKIHFLTSPPNFQQGIQVDFRRETELHNMDLQKQGNWHFYCLLSWWFVMDSAMAVSTSEPPFFVKFFLSNHLLKHM